MSIRYHNQKTRFLILAGMLILGGILAACASGGSNAAAAVESYYTALAAKDQARLASLACADWEEDALLELDSLAAVAVTLQDISCQVSGKEGAYSQVTCSGALVADYNGEELEIDLSERVYQVVEEGGDWRMCGYR